MGEPLRSLHPGGRARGEPIPRAEDRPRPSRLRSALLDAIDAVHREGVASPGARFRARFLVGASLLALLVAVPSLAASIADGDRPATVLLGAFSGCIALQLGALRLRAPLAVVTWTLVITVGAFLVAISLTTRELQPQQLPWLVLLPLAAQVLGDPPGREPAGASRARAPLVAALFAFALGLLVIAAHRLGLTFDRPAVPPSAWASAVDFGTFLASAVGLVLLHDLSVREAQAELARLRELLSVCAWCRKIRDGAEWIPLECYLVRHERHDLTHGICPSCLDAMCPGEER